ncbi:MAG: hypothetical protein C0467_29420 [Planctomycetaceae bacterium]|nr:hypothetical protein [Planctomycetaceae bacterium]
MAQISLTILDPAGNRLPQQVDNYTPVRQAISTFVKQLGLPTQLNYQLIPVGTRSKLLTDKTLAAAGVKPNAELSLVPIRDVMFDNITKKLYDETRGLAQRELWDEASTCFTQLLRVFPDHPDPDELRGSVPVGETT